MKETKLRGIRSPDLVAFPSPAASRWIHFRPGHCYPLSIYIPALYLCLNGGVSVQRYAEQVHFMRTSVCPSSRLESVPLCPNILDRADSGGLDAGNSAVRLSCIALPTLSCHVTVFAFHLSLALSFSPASCLYLCHSHSAPGSKACFQLYTVITLSFCRSSRRDVQAGDIGHAYCMPARKNTAATPFNATSTQECWNLRSQLWQVREIVRKRAQKKKK